MAHAIFTSDTKDFFKGTRAVRKELEDLKKLSTAIVIGSAESAKSFLEQSRKKIAAQREEAAELKKKAAASVAAAREEQKASQSTVNSYKAEAAQLARNVQKKRESAAESTRAAAEERRASQSAINGLREEASFLAALIQEKRALAAESTRRATQEKRDSQAIINDLKEEAAFAAALVQEKRAIASESARIAAEEKKNSQSVINTKREEAAQIQKVATQRKAASDSIIQGINKETAALKKKTAAHHEAIAAANASVAGQIAADKASISSSNKAAAGHREKLAALRLEHYQTERNSKQQRQFYSDWNKAIEENKRRTEALNGAVRGTAREVGFLSKAFQRFGATMLAFATGYLVIQGLGRAFNALRYAVIDFNDLVSRTRISFSVLMKSSVEEADVLLNKLKEFAARTSFNFTDILPLSKQMIALGVATKDNLIPALEGIGGAAAALDVGAEGMGRIIKALGQMGQRARASAEEFNQQLADVGINGIKYVAEAMGKTESQVLDLMKKGMVAGKDAQQAVIQGLYKDYRKFLEAQENEFSVVWSNIVDAATIVTSEAFKPMFIAVRDVLKEVSKVVNTKAFKDWAVNSTQAVIDAFKTLGGIVVWLYQQVVDKMPYVIVTLAALGSAKMVAQITAITKAIEAFGASSMVAGLMASKGFGIAMIAIFAFIAAYREFPAVQDYFEGFVTSTIYLLKMLSGAFWKFISGITAPLEEFRKAWAFTQDIPLPELEKKLGKWGAKIAKGIGDFATAGSSYADAQAYSDEYWDGLIVGWTNGQEKFRSAMGGKLSILPSFDQMMGNARKEMAALAKEMSKAPGIDKISPVDPNSDEARANAAKKLQKDQLEDLIKTYDMLAKAVEDSAKRQMDALTSLRDKLRDLFGSMQDALLKEGIINNPLALMIASFERFIKLGPRMTKTAKDAAASLAAINANKGVAQSQLDKMGGGDGLVPGYNGSSASDSFTSVSSGTAKGIADTAWARQVSGEAKRFVHLCQKLVRTTVQNVTSQFDKFWRGTAAQTMKAFKSAGIGFKANGNYRSGDLVYSGSSTGGGAGHAMIVGSNGMFLDQYGASRKPKTRPEWVVRPGGVAGSPKFVGKNNAAAIKANVAGISPEQFLQELSGNIDGALSKISALPKKWGSAVRETGDSTFRFMAQTMLANKEFQDELRAILGKDGLDRFSEKLRKLTNESDAYINKTKALNAAMAEINENSRQAARVLVDSNPMTELEESFLPGGSRANLKDENAKSQLRRTTQDIINNTAIKQTKDFVKAQKDQSDALELSNQKLAQGYYNSSEYAKNVEVLKFELEQRNQVVKEGVSEGLREEEVMKRSIEFQRLYDKQLKNNALVEHRNNIVELNKQFEALGAETIEQIAHREVYNRESSKYLTNAQKEAEVLAIIRLRMGELNEQIRKNRRDRSDQGELLGLQMGIAKSGATGIDYDEQTQGVTTFFNRYNEIFRQTKDAQLAFNTAQEEAFTELLLGRMKRAVDLQKDYNKAIADHGIDKQGIFDRIGVYQSTTFGSKQQEEALAMLEAEAAVRKYAVEQGIKDNDQIEERVRLAKELVAWRMKEKGLVDGLTRSQQVEQQLIEVRASYARAQKELTRGVGGAEDFQDSYNLSKDIAQKFGKWSDDTDETKKHLDGIKETLRDIDKLAIEKIVNDIKDQTEAMSYFYGEERDAFLRRKELMKMPEMTGAKADEILSAEKYLKDLQRMDEATRSWADSVRGIFDSALNNIYTQGFGSFFSNVLNGFVDLFNKLSSQILSAWATQMLMNLIPGMQGFGGMVVGGATMPMKFATGIDRVPFDGMPAILHRNEAVLTAAQAEDYRASQSAYSPGSSYSQSRTVVINVGTVNTPDAKSFVSDMSGMASQKGQSPSRRTSIRNTRKMIESEK